MKLLVIGAPGLSVTMSGGFGVESVAAAVMDDADCFLGIDDLREGGDCELFGG